VADTLTRALAIEPGYRVRQAREEKVGTLEALAQKTGLTGSAIGNFEQGKRSHWLT
jgi:transcriptional regulator with XRE-family HTH domain